LKKLSDNQCPVCYMHVQDTALSHSYAGMQFVFCSQQCKDRFAANPHLYIGKPGSPSPKQQGKQVIKCRVLKLSQAVPDEVKQHVTDALNDMMGIRKITIESDRIEISYDLMEATSQQIEATLEAAGNRLSSGWGEILKRAFIHYLEETEIDSLEHSGGGHCHH